MSFTLRLALLLAVAVIAAALLAPFVALVLAGFGISFPFARIFDRALMATLLGAIALDARRLGVGPLLRAGLSRPAQNLSRALLGFVVAVAVMAVMFAVGAAASGGGLYDTAALESRLPGYLLGAIVIALIEEGFFRAFLLGGMAGDLGGRAALVLSAIVYALAHVLRSPARFYVRGYAPAAGFSVLFGGVAHALEPAGAVAALFGFFLLGLLLGELFLATGTVYLSMGLHAGLVMGVKAWRVLEGGGGAMPAWISGYGRFPVISGVASWAVIIVMLAILPRLPRRKT